jgi:hypothetical protein
MRILTGLRSGAVAIAIACTLLSGAARASVLILDSVSGNAATAGDSLTSASAPFGLVRTGASDVQIDRFGIYGRLLPSGTATSANVRWAVFSANLGSLPIWDSGPQAVAGTGISTWYDSPLFASPLTLSANRDYYIGLITDANFNLRRFYPGAATIWGNGISSPGGNFAGSNGTVTNFANPALTRMDLSVQVGERVFTPDTVDLLPKPIPLPAAAWLFGSGLLALGAGLRRRARLA